MKKLLLFCFLISSFFVNGQVNLITTTYSQDFNGLTTSTTASTWTDNSIIVGIYAQRSGNGTTIVANAGASNAGGLYSYGNITGTLTDRALGSIGSSGAAAGNFAYGLRLKNNLNSAIASLTIAYTGEQWRFGVAGSQVVNFSYQTSSGTALTSLSPSTVGVPAGFTSVTSLDFTSPVISGTVGALDGNLAANRTTKTATITFTTPVQIGGEILLRWGDPDHAGSESG